ncbi:hypothetical protein HMPREF0043_00619 [Actinobaculum sp. oral taxon 183 str. F0552]|nr:hypothetical protein HMPREF0043_00619 [Actinobaculum sp. oral taxon 183 str. F0552]
MESSRSRLPNAGGGSIGRHPPVDGRLACWTAVREVFSRELGIANLSIPQRSVP